MRGFSYKEYDGIGLAELIKNKEIHPIEVLEEAIKIVEDQNPQLNAVIHKWYEQARNSLDTKPKDGKFYGVPMLLKDISQEIEGETITHGSKVLQQNRVKSDSTYVKQLRKTGVLFLGRTNIPEFALMGITEPKYYGPTKNPWNLAYTPGGSSGGSAAAVASGMVPIAGANDGGGSIRIPAAFCGLFGLKPTRGRTPVGPTFGRHWQGASVEHVLTRSVRDSAAMLDELKIYEKTAAFHAISNDGSYLQCITSPPKNKLRIAYSVTSPIGTDVHESCKNAVMSTVRILESMGHIVEEENPQVDGKKLAYSYLTMYFGEVAAALASIEELLGRKVTMRDVEPETWLLSLLGKATSAEEFVLSIREWDKAAFIMEEFHENYDLYLTPTTAFPPSKIGELEPSNIEKILIDITGKLRQGKLLKKLGIIDQIAETNLKRTPFTQLANLTGQPAMSVPLYQTAEGLPCGVQFMAARGREDILLQLAALLEQTDNWIDIKNNSYFI